MGKNETAEIAARFREAKGTKSRLLQIASEKTRRYRMQLIMELQQIIRKRSSTNGKIQSVDKQGRQFKT